MSHRCYICYKNDLPEGQFYHKACSKRIFGTEEAPEVPYTYEEMKELAKQIIESQQGVTGVQPKISLGLDRIMGERKRLTVMTGEYILKPPSENYSQMPKNEDLTMHLAHEANISTVPHALIPLASGELAYITKRIDRTSKGKIHMEDFQQLAGVADKYHSSMEKVGKLVSQYANLPMLGLVSVYEIIMFCFLTGNADMHLKNFSLIDRKGAGTFFLSPAYDLLNTNILLPQDKEEMALPINGKKARLKLSDFKDLAYRYGLDNRQFEYITENMRSLSDTFKQWIENSFLNDKNKELYTNLLDDRMKRL
ncbi:MAG: HipA domain-containing protein [Bacteroidetes bacterium]|nr:HipA domain-containing protein [Bacteroidota bacterium]